MVELVIMNTITSLNIINMNKLTINILPIVYYTTNSRALQFYLQICFGCETWRMILLYAEKI